MCALCVEILKDKMTLREVGEALTEFSIPEGHEAELDKVIEDKYGKDALDFEGGD